MKEQEKMKGIEKDIKHNLIKQQIKEKEGKDKRINTFI
jgi:hypothetical protein